MAFYTKMFLIVSFTILLLGSNIKVTECRSFSNDVLQQTEPLILQSFVEELPSERPQQLAPHVSAAPPKEESRPPPRRRLSLQDIDRITKSRSKRSFLDVSCQGIYDRDIYKKLDNLCDDCYDLFRKPGVYSKCRNNCFSGKMYEQCVNSLHLHLEEYKSYANLLKSGYTEVYSNLIS